MELSQEIVRAVLDELCDRKGFCYWWDGIDEVIQDDVKKCLEETVDGILSGSAD